jgi:hypothetical protein
MNQLQLQQDQTVSLTDLVLVWNPVIIMQPISLQYVYKKISR